MTHARGAFREWQGSELVEGLRDVPSANVFLSLINWAAYGWKGAIKLARSGGDLGSKNAPDNNADTIALFGSGMQSRPVQQLAANCSIGCKLLRDPENPRKIDSEGRIVPVS
jgi:hypothetical protein